MAPILVVLGSGPGIGLTTAKHFAKKHFSKVVLLSRNSERLEKEKREVEAVAKEAGKDVQVTTISVDLANFDQLREAFASIEKLGEVSTVFFNAARISQSEPLRAPVEELIEDFHITTGAFYITAQWCIPLLQKHNGADTSHPPSLIVTSSHLPEEPEPYLLSLSAVKACQQNVVHSLRKAFGEQVHIGVIKVCGVVSPEEPTRNPENIAKEIVVFYELDRKDWGSDVFVR
ncbi:hypothetical protein CKM354_000502100 [Cercospora kikuchii]|uniref:NAD(P)-binding protein n=1 Tax=Cercospora kikuchii TaxID=84275 RepID=A0A9P3CL43_9PEZI|nr:uncharacterized protein CKM354_000502100 [Cercospora kikuchii]GIZ41725.1 hypothetical protein CKM354_000502100 [Cercospora kikuchii]